MAGNVLKTVPVSSITTPPPRTLLLDAVNRAGQSCVAAVTGSSCPATLDPAARPRSLGNRGREAQLSGMQGTSHSREGSATNTRRQAAGRNRLRFAAATGKYETTSPLELSGALGVTADDATQRRYISDHA